MELAAKPIVIEPAPSNPVVLSPASVPMAIELAEFASAPSPIAILLAAVDKATSPIATPAPPVA